MTEKFAFKLNGHLYNWPSKIITGQEILDSAGLTPSGDYELLIKLSKREFEPVSLTERIDLSDPGVEKFHASAYKKIKVFVDDEPVEFEDCFTNPTEVLKEAGFDPQQYYLKLIRGNKEISYKNDTDQKIGLRNGLRFSTCKLGPATVS